MGGVGHKGVWVGGDSRFCLEIWRDGGRRENGGWCLRPSLRETVNFVWRSGRMGLEWGTGVGSGSPDHGGAARKNTFTEGSLAQKCFWEVQSRSFRMAVDLRTRGPGAGNPLARNLQWKNGVGSDPALRPRPPSADCFEEGGPLTPGCEWRLRACTCRTLLRDTPLCKSVKVQETGPQIGTGDPRE